MKYFIIVVFVLVFAYLIFLLLTKKYRCPYKQIMIFGKKGSGKSTTLTKLALRYSRKGWTVYSTEHTPGSFYIHPSQVGVCELKPHSVLLIDEVSLVWGNRDYKTFRKEVESFFRLLRHYKVRCYLFSQTFDIDKKLRDLTDEMFLMKNVLGVFSYGKRINKKIVLTEAESDRPSTIAENLVFDNILLFWCGSRFFTFIPKYTKYFKSFEAPKLKEVEYPYVEIKSNNRGFKLFGKRKHDSGLVATNDSSCNIESGDNLGL